MQRYKQPSFDVHPDGEWIRYEDHCEAMKRIAGASPEQSQLLEAQHNGAKVGEQIGYAKGYQDGKASASPAALTETVGITKAEVLRVGVEVGLIDRVMDDGDYFTFADHEVMTPRLIKLIEAFRAAPAPSGSPAALTDEVLMAVYDAANQHGYRFFERKARALLAMSATPPAEVSK